MQEYVPEAVESRSVFESPPSPESSYNNTIDEGFFDKDPPLLPPQLHMTVLNVPTSSTDQSLPRPQYSALNHLYVQEKTSDPSVLTLGSTLRFHKKYVTLELYKPSGKFKSKKPWS